MMKILIIISLLIFICQCKPKVDDKISQFPGKPEVPSSIKEIHIQLLQQIHKMTLYKDSSGRAALKLEDLMQHHFNEEEDFILPLLGLLPSLANDKIPEQSKELTLLTEKVVSNLNHMSAEHQLIEAFIEEIQRAADKEHLTEIIEFRKQVLKHASSEEEVFFPAAILVGKYLKKN